MAHEVGTVTVKMTDTELEHAIASLEFYTTLNIPIGLTRKMEKYPWVKII